MVKKTDKLVNELRDSLAEAVGARNDGGPPGTGGPPAADLSAPSPYDGQTRLAGAVMLPLDRLAPDPDQPRKTFDDESLAALAASIRKRGILSPLRAKWDPAVGKWILINGERRLRAAQLVGMATVPVLCVAGELTAVEIRQEQLMDNMHREDLSDMEEAHAFLDYMNLMGCTQKALAAELCISSSKVSRSLSLLDLPADVQTKVSDGALPAKSAIEIARLKNPTIQREITERAVKENLPADRVAAQVRQRRGAKTPKRGAAKGITSKPTTGTPAFAQHSHDSASTQGTRSAGTHAPAVPNDHELVVNYIEGFRESEHVVLRFAGLPSGTDPWILYRVVERARRMLMSEMGLKD